MLQCTVNRTLSVIYEFGNRLQDEVREDGRIVGGKGW
jgi:hypothetical protein